MAFRAPEFETRSFRLAEKLRCIILIALRKKKVRMKWMKDVTHPTCWSPNFVAICRFLPHTSGGHPAPGVNVCPGYTRELRIRAKNIQERLAYMFLKYKQISHFNLERLGLAVSQNVVDLFFNTKIIKRFYLIRVFSRVRIRNWIKKMFPHL